MVYRYSKRLRGSPRALRCFSCPTGMDISLNDIALFLIYFAAIGIFVRTSASGLVRDRGSSGTLRDYLSGLRSALRVERAIRSPTRSWTRASWNGLSRFFGLSAAGSWRNTPRMWAERLKIVQIKIAHTFRAPLKGGQAGFFILSAYRTAAETVERVRLAETNRRHVHGFGRGVSLAGSSEADLPHCVSAPIGGLIQLAWVMAWLDAQREAITTFSGVRALSKSSTRTGRT